MTRARLILADGSVFEGESFGAPVRADGEVVFNTSMTGYQEMLTDPSYAGQILVLTYPMIGNYGVDGAVEESDRIQPTALVVREAETHFSHPRARGGLAAYLRAAGMVALAGVDTRAITRRIRREGVMLGTVTTDETPAQALKRVRLLPGYDDVNWVSSVTTPAVFDWDGPAADDGPSFDVALLDGGVKRNIMRSLAQRGCRVRVYPASASAEEILATAPDGLVLSPGPGDPRLLELMVEEARCFIGRLPVLGICLGHQIAARALGADTFKLPFGHRGGNHPVKDLESDRVTITAQNHGYAVNPAGLAAGAYVSHINLNDETVEGLRMKTEPLITIQYHSEACPGPLDSDGIFDHFVGMMASRSGGKG